MWAPVTVVSIASGIYLYECAGALLSPGTGFTFDYSTPAGPLRITCDNYSIDLFQQAIVAKNLKISKEDGTVVAQIPQVLAKGIAIDDGLSPKVQIKDGEVWINRDVKGDLDILKYLAPSKGGASEQSWQVSLKDMTVHLRDWSANGIRNDVRIPTGNFAGMGDDTEGAIQVDAVGLAQSTVTFKKTSESTLISAKNIDAKIAPVLARLRAGLEKKQLKPIDPLKVSGGDVSGDFKILIPKKGKLRFESNLVAQTNSVRWDQYVVDRFQFKGAVNDVGLVGKAEASYQGLTATADGTLNYLNLPLFGGNVSVAGLTPRHLEQFKIKLPKDVTFASAQASGYLTYYSKQIGWKGNAKVNSLAAYGYKAPQVDADLALKGDQLATVLHPVTIGRSTVSGKLAYNLKTQAISGSITTPEVHASDFSKWLPENVLQSKGQLTAVVEGSISKPNVLVKGTIDPRIKLPDRLLALRPADVVLRYDGQKLALDRLAMNDPVGSFYATGTIDPKAGVNLRLVGNDVDLSKLSGSTAGRVDLQGQVLGTLSDPHYSGKIQGFNIGYTGMPGRILAVATDFSGDRSTIKFKDIEAMDGASQIVGSLGIGFENQHIGGLFAVKGIDIRDLYEGPVGGVLDLNDVVVSGTVSNPLVQGSFEAKKLLAFNYAIDLAKGFVNYDGENIHVSNGSATFAKGIVNNITGQLSVKTKNGKLSGSFEKIDLNDVSQSALQNVSESDGGSEPPIATSNIAIKGLTSGNFDIGIEGGVFAKLTSKGRVDDVTFNKSLIGSGDWDAGFNGNDWTVNAFIGSLDEYFRIDNATYTPSTDAISGEFLTYQIPVQELLVAAEPSLNLSGDNLDRLHMVNGKLGTLLQLSGTVKNPTVEIPEFEISAIKLGDTNLGDFSIKGTYKDRDFTFREGLLQGPKNATLVLPFGAKITLPDKYAVPDGTAKVAGVYRANGQVDISGSIYGFPVSKFSSIAPSLENVDVFVSNADFRLRGTTEKPVLQSKVSLSAGATPNGKAPQSGLLASRLKVNANVSVSPEKGPDNRAIRIDTDGDFHLSTIDGRMSGKIYLDSKFEVAKSAPLDAHLKLDGDRDVSAFFQGIDGVAFGDDGVKMSGGFDVGRTWDNPLISGGLELKTAAVRYSKVQDVIGKPIDLVLRDLSVKASIENDPKQGYIVKAQTQTSSNYSKNNGYLALDAAVNLGDLKPKPNDKGWKGKEISGTLTAKNFGVFQSFLQGSFVQATLDTGDEGPIKIAGTLEKPKISGDIYFANVKTILPTLNPTKSGNQTPVLDPSFDLRFFAKEPMNVKASLAEVNASGDGSLKGTLSNLKADGLLTVDSGSLTLPGGNVKLSPDGTLRLRYESTPYSNRAQLIANLHGETSLTALKNGVTPERYDISLDINGDLLSNSNGLSLTASSQPGDLTQDRILQLLGRTDILTSFLQSGVNSSVESELKGAFASFALPSVLNGLTTDIARNFGLDYFGVDYNVFEQASLSFVKRLGSDFYFQGRQQLFQPLPGQPLAYDFRLSYRPRRGPNAIRALSFSIGTDQLRPYKLSIDFTNRIRTRKGP